MRWSDLPTNPPTRTLRQFAGLWLLFFASLALWQGFVRHHDLAAWICAGVAIMVGLPGLVRPSLIRPVFVGALVATFPIGWVVSRVILAMLYFGLFTPLGLVFRLIGRDPLKLRRQAQRASYWEPKPQAADMLSYFNQY
jgi:hypothetical protein